jgi:hypothetical protein
MRSTGKLLLGKVVILADTEAILSFEPQAGNPPGRPPGFWSGELLLTKAIDLKPNYLLVLDNGFYGEIRFDEVNYTGGDAWAPFFGAAGPHFPS